MHVFIKIGKQISFPLCAREFYFGILSRKCCVSIVATFKLVPRVDSEDKIEEKQNFLSHNRHEPRPKPEENGHEEEGLLRAQAPVAHGGEYRALWRCLSETVCSVNLTGRSRRRRRGGEHMAESLHLLKTVYLLLTNNLC